MMMPIFPGLARAWFIAAALAVTAVAPAAAQAEARSITMAGTGQLKSAPDMVQVTAGVTTLAPTAGAALAANTARMKTVFAAIAKLGVADKNIQTVNFSVSPQYSSGENNSAPRLTGYQVSNEVSVRLEDVAKLGAALDALVTAGANQVNGIDFSIRDTAPLMTEARAMAVADARAKAETYAKAAGVTLGPILSISETGDMQPRPVRMAPMYAMAKSVPVAAGEESVSAGVSITWEIH